MNALTEYPSRPPRLAVLELSSTAVKLLIGNDSRQILNEPFRFEHFTRRSQLTHTRQMVDADNNLDPNRFRQIVLPAILQSIDQARRFNVDYIDTFATAAYRNAANREEILQLIHDHAGLDARLLTQQEEADATLQAFVLSTRHRNVLHNIPYTLVIDLGGGSTELSLYHNLQLQHFEGVDIGTETLMKDLARRLSLGTPLNQAIAEIIPPACGRLMPFVDACRRLLPPYDPVYTIALGNTITSATGYRGSRRIHDSTLDFARLRQSLDYAHYVVEQTPPGELLDHPMLPTRLGLELYIFLCSQLNLQRITISGAALWYAIFFKTLHQLLS